MDNNGFVVVLTMESAIPMSTIIPHFFLLGVLFSLNEHLNELYTLILCYTFNRDLFFIMICQPTDFINLLIQNFYRANLLVTAMTVKHKEVRSLISTVFRTCTCRRNIYVARTC